MSARHLRHWGAVYLILVLFAASWLGQAIAMRPTVEKEGWAGFWAATFENWQSEFLQLTVQATLLGALAHLMFKAQARDTERIEGKIDLLLDRTPPLTTIRRPGSAP